MPKIKDKLYRIFTEAKNTEWLKNEAVHRFGGCIFIEATGAWADARESGLIIEVVNVSEATVKQFARDICRYNEQTSVLVQEIPCVYSFVSI